MVGSLFLLPPHPSLTPTPRFSPFPPFLPRFYVQFFRTEKKGKCFFLLFPPSSGIPPPPLPLLPPTHKTKTNKLSIPPHTERRWGTQKINNTYVNITLALILGVQRNPALVERLGFWKKKPLPLKLISLSGDLNYNAIRYVGPKTFSSVRLTPTPSGEL